MTDPPIVLLDRALRDLTVPHAVVGDMAVACWIQNPPKTLGAVVADLLPMHVGPLASALGDAFAVDLDAAYESIRFLQSFPITDRASGDAMTVLLHRRREWDALLLDRAQRTPYPGTAMMMPTASPEDTILLDLQLFAEEGYRTNERWYTLQRLISVATAKAVQFHILAESQVVTSPLLDYKYLRKWGDILGIRDLLDRLIRGEPSPEDQLAQFFKQRNLL